MVEWRLLRGGAKSPGAGEMGKERRGEEERTGASMQLPRGAGWKGRAEQRKRRSGAAAAASPSHHGHADATAQSSADPLADRPHGRSRVSLSTGSATAGERSSCSCRAQKSATRSATGQRRSTTSATVTDDASAQQRREGGWRHPASIR